MNYLLPFFLLFVLCACQQQQQTTAIATPPNILVIITDDHGYADVGFNGSEDIPTPELDELAVGGTICTAGYVPHPFCGPSRASLMTGRYAHLIGAQFNLPRNGSAVEDGIPLSETFISKILQQSGYYTAAIGKWHLGSNAIYHPNERGFDEFFGFLGGGHRYFPEQYREAYERQVANGVDVIWDYLLPMDHNGQAIKETEYLTDAFSREAVQFINKAEEKGKPFFLYLAYNAPHVPLEAKEEDIAKFTHIKDKKRRTYAAMVHAVDRGVGQVVDALKQSGQYENTLIIFLSDNGGKLGVGGANNFPLRDGKGSTCEGGYRVPMFFHWPGTVPAGRSFDYPISAIDFYPTFAELAGAKLPETKLLDGRNIWADFMANTNPHQDDMIYVLRHRTGYTDVGARKNDWKILRVEQKPWALFDIRKDISEQKDLSAQYPEILKEMVSETEKWSRLHQQPRWFHDEQTGIEWREANMPHFDETFNIKE